MKILKPIQQSGNPPVPYVRLEGKERDEFGNLINDKIFYVGEYLFVPEEQYKEWKSRKNSEN